MLAPCSQTSSLQNSEGYLQEGAGQEIWLSHPWSLPIVPFLYSRFNFQWAKFSLESLASSCLWLGPQQEAWNRCIRRVNAWIYNTLTSKPEEKAEILPQGEREGFPRGFSPQPARTSGHPAPTHVSQGEELPNGVFTLSQPVRDPRRSNQLGKTWILDP